MGHAYSFVISTIQYYDIVIIYDEWAEVMGVQSGPRLVYCSRIACVHVYIIFAA